MRENTVREVHTRAYRVPTDRPEADGTYAWNATTLVLVEAEADSGACGLGFSYTTKAAADLVHDLLAEVVVGTPATQVGGAWPAMVRQVRNVGLPGVAATAISAVDVALWDLRAKLVGQPLYRLLGARREHVPIYGSGGFTSYDERTLRDQLGGWVQQGIPRVKMKIGKDRGTCPDEDVARVCAARDAIGPDARLFVDANGAYTVAQAIRQAGRFADQGVTYFEEPVSSDHLGQLKAVREQTTLAVAAGEYGFTPWYFRDMLRADSVDILQADATRCLGITGFLEAAALAHGFGVPFSAHCAPTLHAHVGCAVPAIEHVEYFHDHARIEQLLFDGAPQPTGGFLQPDPERPGLGLELKARDAERWQIA
ncbi:MAG: enolase C-terminal domain-like protein [Chloroflexota bacterium]